MLEIAIIVGSTRPGRKAEAVAKWVLGIAQSRGDARYEVVDIADYALPLLDEPVPPAMAKGKYSKPHSSAWAAEISKFDGYVFVSPNITTARRAPSRTRSTFSIPSGTTRPPGSWPTGAPAA